MVFREVPYPGSDKFIEPLAGSGELAFIVVPPLKLFQNEIIYWRAQQDEADRAGDSIARRLAHESLNSLQIAAAGRYDIELMQALNRYDAHAAGKWYVTSTLSMAYTRMLREILKMTTDSNDGSSFGFGAKAEDLSAGFDFYSEDSHRSGIHATEHFCRGVLDVEPPAGKGPAYYEGESIYLRASRPADPTTTFTQEYRAFYKTDFQPEDHISFVPRIKTAFWASHPK